MVTNKFELQGRVGYVDFQIADNDKATEYTTINLGVRKAETADENKNWDNVFITFFNSQKNNIAERLANTVSKGDYIRVVGKMAENRYKPKGEEKEKSEIKLIGLGFKKQIFDEMLQEWVDV